ncbi:MAG: hypothetical protein KDD47_14670, partial [Acidobacteria bacterium]|nr:hypothetical protein [Acidobacteriota bacterium]
MTAFLIALAVGAAVALTYFLGERVAQQAIQRALERNASVQSAILERDLQRLQLIAQVLARDPVFVSYVAEAAGGGLEEAGPVDRKSILDQLTEQRDKLRSSGGFDFALVLDPWGVVLARLDRPDAAEEDLSSVPLVRQLIEDPLPEGAADYWTE